MIQRVKASINLQALANNLEIARSYAKKRKIVAVIKANAYGHGLLPAAGALESADLFAVTDIEEAEKLATATSKPILILQGIIERTDIKRIAEGGFQLVIHELQQLEWLEQEFSKQAPAQALTFWLKLNSGMNRLGIKPSQYANAYNNLKSKAWCADIVLISHLANGNLLDSNLNQQQLHEFAAVSQQVPQALTSLPASSGLLAGFGEDCDWVRPGIMLYGSSPFSFEDKERRREKLGLQAVMTLESKLIAIQDCKAGDSVGYCSQFICPKDMRIGIASIGYADGYPSNAPNGTPVLVNAKRTMLAGRVSMDMITVDLSSMPEAKIGDTVTLWGDSLSLDEVAEHTGILSYNLTCSVAARVEKVYG